MKVKDLFPMFKTGKKLVPKNLYSAKDLATALSTKKATWQTVELKNTKTGEIVGKRSIWQK